jgi:tetratricopeptide (TPR) repeat protein
LAAAREAELAVSGTESDVVRAGAGLVLAAAGRAAQAETLANILDDNLEADPRAFGRLVRAEMALQAGQSRAAVERAREAQKVADTWMGRVILGRAYLALKAYPEAYSEFEVALNRKGEATALYLDDVPTYRHLAPVHYYMGLAQQGLRSPAALESFRTFVALKQNGDPQDILLADARRRLEQP